MLLLYMGVYIIIEEKFHMENKVLKPVRDVLDKLQQTCWQNIAIIDTLAKLTVLGTF